MSLTAKSRVTRHITLVINSHESGTYRSRFPNSADWMLRMRIPDRNVTYGENRFRRNQSVRCSVMPYVLRLRPEDAPASDLVPGFSGREYSSRSEGVENTGCSIQSTRCLLSDQLHSTGPDSGTEPPRMPRTPCTKPQIPSSKPQPNPNEPSPNYQMESTWDLGIRSWLEFGFWSLGSSPCAWCLISISGFGVESQLDVVSTTGYHSRLKQDNSDPHVCLGRTRRK